MSASALTSFLDNSNVSIMHIFYLGTNQNVYEMYWTGGWHSDDPASLPEPTEWVY